MKALTFCAALLLGLLAAHPFALAQAKTDIVPDVWQGDVLRPKPDQFQFDRLRFVTDSDYPPFHYFDEEGVLTGFNVDLARAICEALAVECEIRPVDWEDLFKNLDDGEADAAIASIRIDARVSRQGRLLEPLLCDAGPFHRAQRERAQGRSPRNGGRQEDRRGEGHRP